jgi:hypothetical protein
MLQQLGGDWTLNTATVKNDWYSCLSRNGSHSRIDFLRNFPLQQHCASTPQ